MTDVNFQNNNSFNNFPEIAKATDYGQVEAKQHDIISPFHPERQASAGS